MRQAQRKTVVTPPNQQGLQSPKTITTFFDGWGHPLEVDDQLGRVTQYQYQDNADGELLWSEDGFGKPTDYTYDPISNSLLSVQAPDPDGAGPLGRPTVVYRYDERSIGAAATPGQPQQGLQAWYWASNRNQAGPPDVRRTDANVDFNWGSAGPPGLGVTSEYSVRWGGNLVVPTTGDYTFTVVANDGIRLQVDRLRALHKWQAQTLHTWVSQPIHLTAGLHAISLDYFDHTNPSQVQLRWSCVLCSPAIPDQVIPTSSLQPGWGNQTSVVSPGGRVAFSHFAEPERGLPDYTLQQDAGVDYITSYGYDGYGRLAAKVMPKGNANRTIDASGNLAGSVDTRYQTVYGYYGVNDTAQASSCPGAPAAVNQAGLLSSLAHAGMTPTTYVYDARGGLVQETRAAGATCNGYDAEGRLTSSKAPGEASPTTYTYDPNGNVLTVQRTGDATIGYYYDEANRKYFEDDALGARMNFVQYDQDGNLLQRQIKAGALTTAYTTSYGYDDADELTSLTDPAGRVYRFFYDKDRRLKATIYPSTTATFSWTDYNAAGWVTAVYNRHGSWTTLPATVPSDANPIADYAYMYNIDGEKTQEVRTGGGLATETTSYGYDSLGRLAQVTLPDGTNRSYSFDLDSNRTQIAENTIPVASYTYDPSNANSPGLDELTSVTGGTTTSYTYNGDGETTSIGSSTMTWDGRGRNTGGSFSGTSVGYSYDTTGFLYKRVSGTATTYYSLGGLWEATNPTWSDASVTLTAVDGPAGDLAHYAGTRKRAQ